MRRLLFFTAFLISGLAFAGNIHQASDDASRPQSLVKDGTFQVEQKQNLFGKWLTNFKQLEQNPDLVKLDKSAFVKNGQSVRLSNPKGPNVGLVQTLKGVKPGTKSIAAGAFSNCYSLTAITLPESVMCISDSAFSECDLTIYGHAGSYAETYAAEYDIPFTAVTSVTDEASGVVLNGAAETIPANASLQVNCLDTAENRITYDITLTQNGEPVQPAGDVTVKIPVPETMDGELCRVYRAEADGTYTDMNAVNQNGYMVFTTDHFSRYILQAAPRVEKDRSQVRFTAENGDIADAFDYRLISSIPDAVWDLYFASADGTTITAVGFVAANESDRATLADAQAELATVKAQLEESKSRLAESNSQLEESRSQLSETEKQLADTKKQLQEAKAQLAETKERLMDAKERLAGAGERQMMQTLRGGDSYRRQALGDISGAYEDRLEALNKMITSIEGTKEDIIKRARMEAQEEADTIRRKVLVLQDEREKMSWELRKNFEFMSVEFDKMHELLKMLQDKMKRLADAYEQDSE